MNEEKSTFIIEILSDKIKELESSLKELKSKSSSTIYKLEMDLRNYENYDETNGLKIKSLMSFITKIGYEIIRGKDYETLIKNSIPPKKIEDLEYYEFEKNGEPNE